MIYNNMIKNSISLLLVFSSTFTFAQTNVLDSIAKETCECISKKNIDFDNAEHNSYTTELGLCILQSYSLHKNELAESEKLDMSQSDKMEEFGQLIGMRMLNFCPDIIVAIGKNFDKEEQQYDQADKMVFGRVVSITNKNFLTLKIVETSGKTNEFILVSNFENSFLLIDKVLKTDDRIEVSFYEADFYDIKLNKFITQKIITDIKKI